MSKQYGLILPDKIQKPIFRPSKNVFGSDSDEEPDKQPVVCSTNKKRQAKIIQNNALSEDPTVFQYDEIYDDMKEKKDVEKKQTKVNKAPRYIENLIKSAQKRKIENERRIERQVQKEREEEGNEFADKEVFVTSAYKKKLEEMRIEEEKEKREEYLESIGDVTKQKDLGGFYRHLYEQRLGKEKDVSTNKNEDEESKSFDAKTKKPITKNSRNYRKRKSEHNNTSDNDVASDEEINHINLEGIRAAKQSMKERDANLDADSDFSVNDPSDDEIEKSKANVLVQESAVTPTETVSTKVEIKEIEKPVADPPKDIIPEPKIDIWKKRTVGEIFEEALRRYFERKASRCK